MNVVIFTGGNGNANLIKHLKDISYVNLSLLINGYDDGLSTGIIRSANQGMLGPSDFRKNFTYIIDDFTESNRHVKSLFEHRLTADETRSFLQSPANLIVDLISKRFNLDQRAYAFIEKYFILGATQLLEFTQQYSELLGFSLGNIVIGGLFVETKDFNLALRNLTNQFHLTAKLINVSSEDDSKLVAFDAEGNFLKNEADIVNFTGDKPLRSFYLLSFHVLSSLEDSKSYSESEIAAIAKVPPVSKEAEIALSEADVIIFGSGTQFSSLLPSYRICEKSILSAPGKKVAIVNNQYDSDTRNINFDQFTGQILHELGSPKLDFFDAILIDPSSLIKPTHAHPAIVMQRIADANQKHDGQKLWNWICRAIDMREGAVHIGVHFYGNSLPLVEKHYLPEIARLNSDGTRKIKFVLDEESKNAAYHLHIDASGKIALFEIDSWINIVQVNQVDAVIGSRFESRRQLIRSFKHRLVESNRDFVFALITSYVVSFIYFVRFGRIVPDPLSGIYLVKANRGFSYRNISDFLKQINRLPTVQLASFPIGYRTFKEVNLFTKVGTVVKNLVRLYV
jgi:2-phospho-L-lactate transferase/gluconeogenesis factor (CofD/UPF0052 family)